MDSSKEGPGHLGLGLGPPLPLPPHSPHNTTDSPTTHPHGRKEKKEVRKVAYVGSMVHAVALKEVHYILYGCMIVQQPTGVILTLTDLEKDLATEGK